MARKGHPLPASDEARHNEIPEHLERDKGRGDDPGVRLQPEDEPVDPAGNPYPYDDLDRGPGSSDASDEQSFGKDQAAHQDRGQHIAKAETGRR